MSGNLNIIKQSENKGIIYPTTSKVNNKFKNLPSSNEVSYQINKIAVRDAFQLFFTNVKKIKQKGGNFELRFKSRKNKVQSCFIPKSAISNCGIYHSISRNLKYSEKLPSNTKDSRLVCSSGRWYLIISTEVKKILTENQGRIVAIDPGIRSSFTCKIMNIKSKEFFIHDGIRINRDINGARNILCYALLDSTFI